MVATYFMPRAYQVLRQGRRPGSTLVPTRDGGEALIDPEHPKNVYLAYPGSGWEIEVFDPSPSRARRLAVGGNVRPVRPEPRKTEPPAPPPPTA
jgi:hypothetical protein